MSFKKFEDILAWQVARELNKSIYSLTIKPVFNRDFGLRDQFQRASVSIMLNIAEGFDSGSHKSFNNYLSFSFRSASEVQSILYIALDLNYINQSEFNLLFQQTEKIKRLIGGLKRYLSRN